MQANGRRQMCATRSLRGAVPHGSHPSRITPAA
jgi:hypothetical protein